MQKQPNSWVTQLVMLALTAGTIIFLVTGYLDGVVGHPVGAPFRDVGGFIKIHLPTMIGFVVIGAIIIVATKNKKQ